jgi:hypothetical protein
MSYPTKEEDVVITYFWNFDWYNYRMVEWTGTFKALRGGVIPYGYVPDEGMYYYLLAIDRRSRQYTDLGGGIKKYEIPYQGALRELAEESIMLYSDAVPNPYDIVVAVGNTFDIFVYDARVERYPNFRNDIVREFSIRKHEKVPSTWLENSGITWLSYTQLISLSPDVVFTPTYNTLQVYISHAHQMYIP